MPAALLDKTLIYVTGKGGVGKTTVAASLGLVAARAGKRAIVCEVATHDRLFRAFARQGVGSEEVELTDGLYAVSVDPNRALEEWLGRQLGGPLVRTLARSSAFQYFVAAAPGAKELITIAKVWEIAQLERWTRSNRTYDLVIVDAPASGHGIAMLETPRTFAEIARVGPIRRQAQKVGEALADPDRTAYVAVALPEEMPVTETIELGDRLTAAIGARLDAIVVNALLPDRFTAEEADRLREAAERNGHDPAAAGALRAALREHVRAVEQRSHLHRLRRDGGARLLTLPFLFEPEVGLAEYERLADALAPQLDAA